MNVQKSILVVSRDPMALQTRKLMLGAYFDVSAAGRVPEAKQFLAVRDFDLIVLCYTLSDDDCQKIVDTAKGECPHAKILMLTVPGDGDRALTYPHLPAEEGPFILVKKSAELLGFEFGSKGRMLPAAHSSLLAVPSTS